MRRFLTLVGILTILSSPAPVSSKDSPSHSQAAKPQEEMKFRERLQRFLDNQAAVPFTGLRRLRYGIGAEINQKFDAAEWLKAPVTVALTSIGISMVEQAGQDIDISLPCLTVQADISRPSGKEYSVFVSMALARVVRLVDLPDVTFMPTLWQKQKFVSAANLSEARFAALQIVQEGTNEFVRYWAVANSQGAR